MYVGLAQPNYDISMPGTHCIGCIKDVGAGQNYAVCSPQISTEQQQIDVDAELLLQSEAFFLNTLTSIDG